MHIPKWFVAPFYMKIYNKCHESELEDELIEMHLDLEAKVLLKSQNLAEYWSNIIYIYIYNYINTAT